MKGHSSWWAGPSPAKPLVAQTYREGDARAIDA